MFELAPRNTGADAMAANAAVSAPHWARRCLRGSARINASGAGLVFVGLRCPKQEFWMQAHQGQIHAVMLGVGAAFEFIAGTVARAPLWMRELGLEWLHRLASEPRRLWRRYLVTNSLFVWGRLGSWWHLARESDAKSQGTLSPKDCGNLDNSVAGFISMHTRQHPYNSNGGLMAMAAMTIKNRKPALPIFSPDLSSKIGTMPN